MKRIALAIAGISYSLISFTANAAEKSIYLGVGLGQSYYKIDDGLINESSSAMGAKIFGGVKFTSYFAVEGGYSKLGNASLVEKTLFTSADGTTSVRPFKGETVALYLAAKATAQINDLFSVYAKLGASRNNTTCLALISFSIQQTTNGTIATSNIGSSTCHSTGLLAAIGVDYHLAKNTAIGIDYTSHGKIASPASFLLNSSSGSSRANMLSVNVRYSF